VDGGVHNEPDQAAYDRIRTEYLVAGGLQVMRVTNREVLTDLAGVLRRIARELRMSGYAAEVQRANPSGRIRASDQPEPKAADDEIQR
jgi:hypothetical protein